MENISRTLTKTRRNKRCKRASKRSAADGSWAEAEEEPELWFSPIPEGVSRRPATRRSAGLFFFPTPKKEVEPCGTY